MNTAAESEMSNNLKIQSTAGRWINSCDAEKVTKLWMDDLNDK